MGTKQFRTNDALVTLVSNFYHGFSEFSWHYDSLTTKNKTIGHSQFIEKIGLCFYAQIPVVNLLLPYVCD